MNVLRSIPIILFAGLAAVSLWVLSAEFHTFRRPLNTRLAFYDFLGTPDNRAGFSSYSKEKLLLDCLKGMTSPVGQSLPEKSRKLIAGLCEKRAKEMTVGMPTSALAWDVVAQAAMILGEVETFRTAFVTSRQMAPNETWLAKWRVRLAQHSLQMADARVVEANRQDLAMLAGSPAGVQWLSSIYIGEPQSRALIVEVMDTMPGAVQQKFLYVIKTRMRSKT